VNRKFKIAAVGVAVPLALAACAEADPDTSQKTLHYTGGAFSSQAFDHCINPGVHEFNGVGDFHFYYPNGTRTYTFSDAPGADAPPIMVSTASGIELKLRGTVTFHLNTSCEKFKDFNGIEWAGGRLQRFHDEIGRHKGAYASGGGERQPDGWNNVLREYIGSPAETVMDDAGLPLTWQELYGDGEKRRTWEQTVLKALPERMLAKAKADHFIIDNVELQKPDLPDQLKNEQLANQAAVLRKQTADTDSTSAKDFPGGLPAYLAYQQQLAALETQKAITKAINEGKANLNVVPSGATVNLPGSQPK
jgi:hypothetical protein